MSPILSKCLVPSDLFKQDPVLRAQMVRVPDGGQTVEGEDGLAVDAADGG